MKSLMRLLPLLAMLLCSSYLLTAILASGEGEPIVLIGNYAVSRGCVFVLGLVGVVGGLAVSLASLTDVAGVSRYR
jgi:hypothetical protein